MSVGCPSSHADAFFSSQPISCLAKISNRLAWTVRSWRIVGSGGGGSLLAQQSKVYPKTSAPARAKRQIPQTIQNVSVCGQELTGPSIRAMVELRHDVLMIDREFERWSVRTNPWSAPASVPMYHDLSRSPPMSMLPKGRSRGGVA